MITPFVTPTPRRASPSQRTILLVDDESAVRLFVHRILRRAGYRVLAARSGADALVLADQSRNGLDLLLTDIAMPRMSGREVADRLAALQPGLPVLYMADGGAEQIARQGVLDAGCALLEKPFTPDALLAHVGQLLVTVPLAGDARLT
jgi:two-component system, cell cycle sensor histidine kinase and response regulator CckA